MHLLSERELVDGTRHNRQLFADYALDNCTFGGAGLQPDWSNPNPSRRPTIRNVTLRNTIVLNAFLEGAIVENVTVDTTKAGRVPLFLRGNAYQHVILKGRVGHTQIWGKMFPPLHFTDEKRERIEADWDKANA